MGDGMGGAPGFRPNAIFASIWVTSGENWDYQLKFHTFGDVFFLMRYLLCLPLHIIEQKLGLTLIVSLIRID